MNSNAEFIVFHAYNKMFTSVTKNILIQLQFAEKSALRQGGIQI